MLIELTNFENKQNKNPFATHWSEIFGPLLKRKRKLAAHFHHSAKATANLKELQIAELLKPNPAFPFDRPASSLTKKRRRR